MGEDSIDKVILDIDVGYLVTLRGRGPHRRGRGRDARLLLYLEHRGVLPRSRVIGNQHSERYRSMIPFQEFKVQEEEEKDIRRRPSACSHYQSDKI